jgi:hypothetical protein
MTVNTAKVQGRRQVKYSSYAELLADADRVAAGPVKTLGNWSAGQIFQHLANAYLGSLDGYEMKAPWYVRAGAWVLGRWLLSMRMPAGFKLPPDAARELVPPPTTTEEGLAALKKAVARLQAEPQRARHPVFGNLSNADYDRLHLNHASMHMSFLIPE